MNSEGGTFPGAVPPELFEEIYRRHGHRCPMSTLGGRLGYAVFRHLAADPDEDLLAIYHTRTCALDGIGVATGCTLAAGNLLVREEGRHALTLVRRQDGGGVEATLSAEALAIAGEYRKVSEVLERERPGLSGEELREREGRREAILEGVLVRLRGEDEENLLEVRPVLSDPEALGVDGRHA
ncbi:formylmethanofuran dehydrogenase subunit E [Desulfuromonas soudanensis]|uniref:Formylmethanofuran dehydrogenase subunit E n=1 Tax=Desulfuromonas soudanensis TaxID=1603606 RepID=A0A0M4DKD6_9BACT|nr:formylmethanofuran dehydrogenase subunit E family protein [Desulfuromonas soudanensis]ALC17720.1 formylmethanofuran dehydrogenase subunit E [Desulfuromonas soudanensis]